MFGSVVFCGPQFESFASLALFVSIAQLFDDLKLTIPKRATKHVQRRNNSELFIYLLQTGKPNSVFIPISAPYLPKHGQPTNLVASGAHR